MAMGEKRRKFDHDFREGAVRLVRETGKPVAQVARDLGINEGTLGNWVNADKRRRQRALLLDTITLSDGEGQRERTLIRRYGRQLDRQFDCLNCVPNGRFCVARLSCVTDPGEIVKHRRRAAASACPAITRPMPTGRWS